MPSQRCRKVLKAFLMITASIIAVLASFQVIKFVFGTSSPFCVVVSPSMYPTLKIGDFLIVKSTAPSELKVGDIIVFHNPLNPEELTVHRIVAIIRKNGKSFFKTKGDANAWNDPWIVSEELIEGKVEHVIPYVGFITIALQPPINYILMALLIVMIVLSEILGSSE
ncbi:signal peptidase I [Candidatus Geothermarchaeota archaeon]|nr:MAG: signal peptidase I [Candidatus Geothermarchaeota archaeon]